MRTVISLFSILSIFFILSCNKKTDQSTQAPTSEQKTETQAAAPSLGTKCAKWPSNVFKDVELKNRIATLLKAEQVSVLEELSSQVEGKNVDLVKVKLSDDSIGYIKKEYLANKAIVFVQDGVKVYERNNPTSLIASVTISKGYIGMVSDEKANWLKVTVGTVDNDKKVYDKWVQDGFSEDPELIQDAVMLESAKKILTGEKKDGDMEEAKKQLETISKKGSAVAEAAQKLLSAEGQPDQTPAPAEGTKTEDGKEKK